MTTKNELVEQALKLGSRLSEKDLSKLSLTALRGVILEQEDKNARDAEIKELKEMMALALAQTKPQAVTIDQPEVVDNISFNGNIFDKISSDIEGDQRRRKAVDIPNDLLVEVMNCTAGVFFWKSPTTSAEYRFLDYGSIEEIPFQEIKTMRNRNPKILRELNLIILNKDVADALNLTSEYTNILMPDQVPDVVRDLSRLTEAYEKGSEVTRDTLVRFAIRMYHSGDLTNLNIVRFFEDKYDIKMDETLSDDPSFKL